MSSTGKRRAGTAFVLVTVLLDTLGLGLAVRLFRARRVPAVVAP